MSKAYFGDQKLLLSIETVGLSQLASETQAIYQLEVDKGVNED